MSELRILVCGDVEGHFRKLFTRMEVFIKKKGPFEFLLCVGNFFGSNNDEWMDLKAGKIKVPITVYILGPNAEEHLKFYPPGSGELVPNIIYLGKKGMLSGSSGVKIAYMSGVEEAKSTGYSFSKKDVIDLTNTLPTPIDILLTSQWPRGVTLHGNTPENGDPSEAGSHAIAYLAKYLKPRYQFAGISGVHYERLPYGNLDENFRTSHCTRFVGLGKVGGDKKWAYGFNLIPFSKNAAAEGGVVTLCPYEFELNQEQFFYDITSSGSNKRPSNETSKLPRKKTQNHVPVTQDKCWFCMENPNFEKQLMLSIGEFNYITLAKGGMVKEHLLIIPIGHSQSSVNLAASEEYEINRYKEDLVKYFDDKEENVVFFERSLASPHLQVQVVPIPKSKEIKENIMKFAATNGIELRDLSKYALVRQLVPNKKNFFYAEIWVEGKKVARLLHVIERKFPLQFGRMMLACKDILNIPERVDWKECKIDPDDELKVVENFKRSFYPYDHHV